MCICCSHIESFFYLNMKICKRDVLIYEIRGNVTLLTDLLLLDSASLGSPKIGDGKWKGPVCELNREGQQFCIIIISVF